jgi:hypothetical protein
MTWSFSAKLLVILLSGLCFPVAAAAAPDPQRTLTRANSEAQVAACIRAAAAGRPWLEATLWGLRDQEGGWIGAKIPNSNGSHDLGPLQINSWWVPRIAAMLDRDPIHVRRWLTYDPCFNADAARWIFLSAFKSTGDYWRAVGAYHSPTQWRQRRYAGNVARRLQRRFGAELFRPRTSMPLDPVPAATPRAQDQDAYRATGNTEEAHHEVATAVAGILTANVGQSPSAPASPRALRAISSPGRHSLPKTMFYGFGVPASVAMSDPTP